MSITTFDTNIPDAVTQADDMPSLPAIAVEVLRLTQDEDSTIESLANCLSRDPALSAKILKLSNSAMFSMGQEITTMQRATMVLGFKTVKLMSLSFSLVAELPADGTQGGFNMMSFWKHSLVRSVSSRSLAKFTGSRLGDEAFLCGLLAHFGRLVLSRVMTDPYEAVINSSGGWPSLKQEEDLLGFCNTDVCATILKEWGIPEMIYLATGHGAHPDQMSEDTISEIKDLVYLQQLSSLVEEFLCSDAKGDALSQLHALLADSNDMDSQDVDEFLIGLEGVIRETAELFSLDLPESSSHDEIMKEAKLQMVNVSLGTTMDLRQAHKERDKLATEKKVLVNKANTDALTKIANRSLFDEFLQKHVDERMDGKKSMALGLIMIDIDHFKTFNDTYGHAAGDEVLRQMGVTMARETRKGDLAARYGGEEFAVVVAESNPVNLKIMANRIRAAIESMQVSYEGTEFQVTVSMGCACISEFTEALQGEALVKLADAYLYKAKHAGRNRVESYKFFKFPTK